VVAHVLVDLFDLFSLADKDKQIDGEYLLVGESRVGVVALPLNDSTQVPLE
jgi:hypothetical protein